MLHHVTRELVILCLDGIADSSLAVLLDVVRAAAAIARRANRSPPLRATIVSPSGARMRTGTGVTRSDVRSLRTLTSRPPDVLVVPGIWVEDPTELPAHLSRRDVALAAQALARAHAGGALVAGTCAGAFVLARSGLLDRKRATTTWWLAAEMRALHPTIDVKLDEALVVHGRVITAGAVFAVADLALYLVARFGGPALARETARVLLLDRHASQARYMAKHHLRTHDAIVRRAESWARAHLADRFDIGALARASGSSSRTLARRLEAALGLSPIGFVQQLRLEHAINLIETSSLAMDEIASRVGYEDANTLRRLVRRETRTTPRELRARS
jgi:transcriptional regulator GlxA family with amidase domain